MFLLVADPPGDQGTSLRGSIAVRFLSRLRMKKKESQEAHTHHNIAAIMMIGFGFGAMGFSATEIVAEVECLLTLDSLPGNITEATRIEHQMLTVVLVLKIFFLSVQVI